ncbi:hypothetical protein BJV77DRAFT_999450, partial [Russula vinacea]
AFRPGVVDLTDDQLAVNRNAITLPTSRYTLTTADDLQFGVDDSGYGYEVDLGLTFGDEPATPHERSEADDMSVEVGRDAAPPRAPRESLDSHLLKQGADELEMLSRHSRAPSEHAFPDVMDFGFGPEERLDIDLDLDFGDRPISEGGKTPEQTRSPSRASSPLSEVPVTPPADVEMGAPQLEQPDGPVAEEKRKRKKKQIFDDLTELEGPLNAMDVSSILTDHQYLPRSSVVMRLLEIREDPIAHFLPTRKTPSKRARIEPEGEGSVILEDDGEPGQARRASVAPSQGVGSEMLGHFQMDIGREDLPPVELIREKSVAPSELTRISRASTPALEEGEGNETYADLECPIVAFDTKSSSQVSETDSTDGKGYSKNTIRALGIVRKELEPVEGEAEEKVMSFKYMATRYATRRAAAAFFFELLVLGTRDCVQLSQPSPFENIEVRPRAKLWDRRRHGSIAPSISSSMGL